MTPFTQDDKAIWTAVDEYYQDLYIKQDLVLEDTNRASDAAGLPAISVSQTQGKFLNIICSMVKARRVLEIGTLAGYSTLWMARAIPQDGVVVTLESNKDYARVAQKNIDNAGFTDRIQIVVGPALDTLPDLANVAPFDVVFVDADKVNNKYYYEWALALTKPGTVIIMDNVVREGKVIQADLAEHDQSVRGIREFNDIVARDPRVTATALQTVGIKGYDGFAMLLVN